MEGFTNGSVAIFEEIFGSSAKDFIRELFYSELKMSQRPTLYLLSSYR